MNQIVPTFPKSVQPGIPKLELTPDGWTRYRLGDLFDVVSRPVDLDDDTEYDLVTVKRSRGGIAFRERLSGRKIAVKSQFYIREGDFLLSKRQIVHGACGVVSAEFDGSIVSNEYAVLRPRKMLLLEYLGYLVHSTYMQQTFFHASIGVHVEKMIFKIDDWLKWLIHLPHLEVQQEIVDTVNAVDGKVKLLEAQIKGLEDFKCGLMQQLFSRQIRFTNEDGSKYPDWIPCRFGEIVERFVSPFDPRKEDNNPPLVELENIDGGSGRLIGFSDLEDQISIKSRFEPGDVLFGKLRPYLRKFAKPEFAGVCSSEIWVIRGIRVSPDFLFYLIQSERFIQRAVVSSSGSKMPRADWQTLADTIFDIPEGGEQERISGLLSSFDAKIDAVSAQITHMETFKKGLLQKLFV